jgi:putative membrane protein
VFRNVRHVPYARIQNLDLRQNPVHRWLGVADVTVQTASGSEAEARLRVVSLAAVEALRQRVFADRGEDPAVPAPGDARQTLLALGPRELVTFGLLHGRGGVVAAAIAGVAWQWFDSDDTFWSSRPWEGLPSLQASAWAMLGMVLVLVVLLVALRVLSVAWAFVTLAGFRLERSGEDLRTTGGLLTRRQATIPRDRIQVLTIEEGVLPRVFGRVLVQADTAGGAGEDGEQGSEASRAWIAPVLPRAELPRLLAEVAPEIDLQQAEWRPISPRALARLARKRVLLCGLLGAALWAGLGPAGLIAPALLLPLLLLAAWARVRTTAWAVLPRALAVRDGWWTRRTRVVRFAKMQVVQTLASGFDRRARMAHVRVDTAAARSPEIVVPYLEQDDAQSLADRLSAAVEKTRFEW